MPPFLRDVFSVLRFDFKPLGHYVYPAWQPLAWLTLIGVVAGIGTTEFQAALPVRIAFFVGLNWVEAIGQVLWLMAWQRYLRKKPVTGSLFPVLVIAGSPQLLAPALTLLPESYFMTGFVLLLVYSFGLLVMALAEALEEAGWRIVLALLAFSPIAFTILSVAMSFAMSQGWIVPPAELVALPKTV